MSSLGYIDFKGSNAAQNQNSNTSLTARCLLLQLYTLYFIVLVKCMSHNLILIKCAYKATCTDYCSCREGSKIIIIVYLDQAMTVKHKTLKIKPCL